MTLTQMLLLCMFHFCSDHLDTVLILFYFVAIFKQKTTTELPVYSFGVCLVINFVLCL